MAASSPIWRDRIFASIYLEPYLDEAEGEQTLPPIGDAINFVHALLRELKEAYPNDAAISSAAEVCADAERLHPPGFDSLASQQFLDFLGAFMQRVQRLRVGEVLLTPAFWGARSGVLFVLGKPTRGSSDYTLAVCSTGDGARYHPTHPCLLDGRIQRAVTLQLHGLAAERLSDSSFWFALFHCIGQLHAQPQLSWTMLYERLLPYGAQQPLSDFFPAQSASPAAAATEPAAGAPPPASPTSITAAESTRWRTLPASGHHRSLIAVFEALHAALSMQGSHRTLDAERVELLLRFQASLGFDNSQSLRDCPSSCLPASRCLPT